MHCRFPSWLFNILPLKMHDIKEGCFLHDLWNNSIEIPQPHPLSLMTSPDKLATVGATFNRIYPPCATGYLLRQRAHTSGVPPSPHPTTPPSNRNECSAMTAFTRSPPLQHLGAPGSNKNTSQNDRITLAVSKSIKTGIITGGRLAIDLPPPFSPCF